MFFDFSIFDSDHATHDLDACVDQEPHDLETPADHETHDLDADADSAILADGSGPDVAPAAAPSLPSQSARVSFGGFSGSYQGISDCFYSSADHGVYDRGGNKVGTW